VNAHIIIDISWVAFLIVWAVTATRVKPDVRNRDDDAAARRQRTVRAVIAVIVIILVVHGGRSVGRHLHYMRPPPVIVWTGAALVVIGIAFAIWARLTIGRNWSSRPATKVDHELVTTGPYAAVRHPIYSGLILATLGTATTGSILGAFAFVAGTIIFSLRIGREESLMLARFPDQYPAYRARTRRLVPFVW